MWSYLTHVLRYFSGGRAPFERWPACRSRCPLPETSRHPCSLFPHRFFPNSSASAFAPGHRRVARHDSDRTVSSLLVLNTMSLADNRLINLPRSLKKKKKPTLSSLARCCLPKSGIELPNRYEPSSTCPRNNSPLRKYSRAPRGKGAGRSQRKSDRSQVVHRLRLSATVPSSEISIIGGDRYDSSGRVGGARPVVLVAPIMGQLGRCIKR
jgi:hypothetical protein